MSQTLEQFIRFETDIVGLERTLRMVHALLQVMIFYPVITGLILFTASMGSRSAWAAPSPQMGAILLALRGNVAMARRWFRLFRFVESFNGAYKLYASLSAPAIPAASSEKGGKAATPAAKAMAGGGAEVWLDILSRSFNGMYLLLETVTLPDALGIDGLRPWGALAGPLFVESQRFWFLALACSALSGAVKLTKVFAHAPVPETGEGYGLGEKEGEEERPEWERERERLRRAVAARKAQRVAWRREVKTRSRGIVRKLAADFLDMAIPGAVVGWVRVDAGTVGVVMLVTTYLTGKEVWERCGREVGKA
ncbi:hypothetical protein NKR23_g3105 [Pleurostoma richardsiae]|uniref:Uncharacterized protein n=1 Tax=Pleurostoma richardsiae TaxID=41990 RepID=A0AA38RN98_9PEZI|nr:hypothetical protein NKR23_g3105 [Pleurostoma richardsiae]